MGSEICIRASHSVYRNIFDNLLTRDASGEIVGQIATEWNYLDDTTIEIKIRDDVSFQDGTKLIADDAAYPIMRLPLIHSRRCRRSSPSRYRLTPLP